MGRPLPLPGFPSAVEVHIDGSLYVVAAVLPKKFHDVGLDTLADEAFKRSLVEGGGVWDIVTLLDPLA
jgi:hypothetical protein